MTKTYRRRAQENDLYKVVDWRGYTLYQCRRCAFDTTDALNLFEHLRGCQDAAGSGVNQEETVNNANSSEE